MALREEQPISEEDFATTEELTTATTTESEETDQAADQERERQEVAAAGLQLSASDPKATQSKKGKGTIEPTSEAMGNHMATEMTNINTMNGYNVIYASSYREWCIKNNQMDKWDEDYRNGFADPEYWERTSFMQWKLKPGKSASEAMRAWLKGPDLEPGYTIAECLSTLYAIQTKTVLEAIGDEAFDDAFGRDGETSTADLQLGVRESSVKYKGQWLQDRKEGEIGERDVNVGDWYYFYNHPKYLLKHPGGAWQGENAIYMGRNDAGEQLWSGFGAHNVTEPEMYQHMVEAYNGPRGDYDNQLLDDMKARNGGKLPEEYDPKSGEFPDTISVSDILSAPSHTLGGTTRRGGFVLDAGRDISEEKVKRMTKDDE
jgi:hypothetical protein